MKQQKKSNVVAFQCPTGFAENYKGQAHRLSKKGKRPIAPHPKTGSIVKFPAKKAKKVSQKLRAKIYGDERALKVLVKNPKRPGTKAWKKFELYRGKKTVQEYLDAGGKMKTIAYDLERGYIGVDGRCVGGV